jgi:hypothetical protein
MILLIVAYILVGLACWPFIFRYVMTDWAPEEALDPGDLWMGAVFTTVAAAFWLIVVIVRGVRFLWFNIIVAGLIWLLPDEVKDRGMR